MASVTKVALSKEALRADKTIREVASTLRENRGVFDDGLTGFFQPHLGSEETLPAFGQVLDLMVRCLDDTRRTVVRVDQAKLDELAIDSGLRIRRDELASDLYGELVALKGAVRSAHGAEGVEILGFAQELGSDPVVVLRQLQRILANLVDPDKPLPSAKVAGTGIRPEEVTQALGPRFEALRDVLRQLDAEQRETVTAQLVKDANRDQYRRIILNLARASEAFYRLIGRDDLADRIPAILRRLRRGRRVQVPDPPTSQTSESGTDAP